MNWLCRAGHVASSSDLAARGVSRRRVTRALADGELVRLRVGVYACPHLAGPRRDAAAAGLLPDCVTWLSMTPDQWTGRTDARLHLFARGGRHHGPAPDGSLIHWSRSAHGGSIGALSRAARCLDPYDWLAAVESAVHLRTIDPQELARLEPRIPPSHRGAFRRIDLGAQSGLETHARCRLEDAGHRVQTQVAIPGTTDLDLLVDGLVGVETDGRRWHDGRFIADRTKDLVVESWGIRMLRIGAVHVFDEWPTTLGTIERMLDDARRSRLHTPRTTPRWASG